MSDDTSVLSKCSCTERHGPGVVDELLSVILFKRSRFKYRQLVNRHLRQAGSPLRIGERDSKA